MVEKDIEFNPIKLRLDYFKKDFPFDNELAETVKEIKGHEFLERPLTQNMHIYLVEYLLAFSRKWLSKENISVLDWGCGKCQVSYLLKKRNVNVLSCDVDIIGRGDSALGQYTPIADFAQINVIPLKHEYILPFADKSIDVVLSFGVLEHVPNAKESLVEITRILKPNGLFFCFWLPYKYSWRSKIIHMQGSNYHDHLYIKEDVKKLLDYSGLKLIDFWYRDMLPLKSKISNYRKIENIDNWLCRNTILKYLSSNIEFVAKKGG